MPPKAPAKSNDRAGGVLAVNAATRAAANKGPAPKLKLNLRRLPPGLTLDEFEETLGDNWKLGNGKVAWREFCPGKVKPGKHPQQARCYLLLANEPLIWELDKHFRTLTFHDRAGTYRLPELKSLPPTIEFADNQRTPVSVKQRADQRQGTIDQDPEFMAFLEGQTRATEKLAPLDALGAEKKETEKPEVKSTPLIEALREKKANKAKAAEAKSEKKDGKVHARADSKDAAVNKKDAKEDKTSQQQNVQQASKEAVKVLNKQVANKQQQSQQRPDSPQQPQAKNTSPAKSKKAAQSSKPQNTPPTGPANNKASAATTTPQAPASQREPRTRPQRGNAEGIKKMLQKDLGIKPKQGPAAQNASSKSSQTAATTPTTPSTPIGTNIGNKTATKQQAPSAPASPAPAATKGQHPPSAPKQQPQTQAGISATKAYLKHANPSQGMTEILIQQALSQYGELTNVTIDPRKGTAIALFKDSEGLKNAMEAKHVPVANGKVEVLEFKDRASGGGRGGFRGGRGGGRGGRGGQQASNAAASAPAAPKTEAGS
ncbi:nuclear localization sequence-binding -like [Lecanosticta acicola]|uniref:Nuclear localization sequence-binding -like n=1 Tax=Lecanosticta acicola TaxID=111012 RepID=A0AAI9E943_9PEZI|nr:nuclear localization sequence-binding -like [Lecanosticta acicola]